MTKAEKQAYIEELVTQLKGSKAAIFTEYHGTSVPQMEKLRTDLYGKGISYKIAKNSLVKRALGEVGVAITDESILDRPIAIAASGEDEVTVAKAVVAVNKELESIVPIGGIVNGNFVGGDMIKTLSTLPGREELYAKMVGSIAGLPTRMVRTFANPLQGLVTVLTQVKSQKEA